MATFVGTATASSALEPCICRQASAKCTAALHTFELTKLRKALLEVPVCPRDELEAIDHADRVEEEKLAIASKETGGRVGEASNRLQAKDMMAMAEVAYADTMVKKRAEDDSETIVEAIMSGRFRQSLPGELLDGVSDEHLVEALLGFIAPTQPVYKSEGQDERLPVDGKKGESSTHGSEETKMTDRDGIDDRTEHASYSIAPAAAAASERPSSYEKHPAPAARHPHPPLRSNSSNTEISTYEGAVRWLEEEREVTRTKWHGAVRYRYILRLNSAQLRLEWRRIGAKKDKRHVLPLDITLSVQASVDDRHIAFESVHLPASSGSSLDNSLAVFHFPRPSKPGMSVSAAWNWSRKATPRTPIVPHRQICVKLPSASE